jgi:hypothetical protein
VNGGLSHEGMEKLCQIVQLTELNISKQSSYSESNNIGDSGAIAIAKGLKNLTTLDIGKQESYSDSNNIG